MVMLAFGTPEVAADVKVPFPPLHGRFCEVIVELMVPEQAPPPAPVNVAELMLSPVPFDAIVPSMVDWLQLPLPIELETVAVPSSDAWTLPE